MVLQRFQDQSRLALPWMLCLSATSAGQSSLRRNDPNYRADNKSILTNYSMPVPYVAKGNIAPSKGCVLFNPNIHDLLQHYYAGHECKDPYV